MGLRRAKLNAGSRADHLSFAHSALNSLLQLYRTPPHNPADFASFYDVVGLPFREVI